MIDGFCAESIAAALDIVGIDYRAAIDEALLNKRVLVHEGMRLAWLLVSDCVTVLKDAK